MTDPVAVPEGSKLVYARVSFYQGLKAGSVGLVPNEIAELAIAANYATEVDSLDARVEAHTGRVAAASEIYPSGTTGPQEMSDRLDAQMTENDGIDRTHTETIRPDADGHANQLVDNATGQDPTNVTTEPNPEPSAQTPTEPVESPAEA